MKKFATLILIIFLAFLTSCNKKTTSKTVSFSTWGSQSEIATTKKLILEFEKQNPEIKVKLIHIPDNYFQKLHLLIASDLAPDVMFVNNLNSGIYITAGKFEPLNDYIKNSKTLSESDFYKNSFLPISQNGKIYAIPRDISNLVIYYNKDLFDRYGVPYPESNWTMDKFLSTAQKLTKDTDNNGKIDIFGFGFENKPLFWLPFLWSNGGGILSDDGKKIILSSRASTEALQFYSDLRNKYHVAPKSDEQASLTTSQLFLQGKVAMHLCGRWCTITYKKSASFNWDTVIFPKWKNGSIVDLDTSGWAISASSKNKVSAMKFIEFMASAKTATSLAKDGLILPARKSPEITEAFMTPPPKNAQAFIDAVNNGKATPLCTKYTEIIDIINETIEPVFEGKVSAKDVITDDFAKKLQSMVK